MFAVVTGASGHLGANLVRSLLAKKWKIRPSFVVINAP